MIAVALCSLSSCDPETDVEAGGTLLESMAGKWDVTVDLIDADGNVLYEDPYGIGVISIMTYNSAANNTTDLWLDDQGNFWAFKFKTLANLKDLSFVAASTNYDPTSTYADTNDVGNAVVTNGKILPKAATNLHGMPNDSIVFDIAFDDDDPSYRYRISGQRYTGFYE